MTTEEGGPAESLLAKINSYLGIDGITPPPMKPKLYDGFLLPIDYLDKSQVHLLSPTVSEDLELVQMYHHLSSPSHDFSKQILGEVKTQYTSNTDFLQDTQKVVENIPAYRSLIPEKVPDVERFKETWKEVKEDTYFLETHSYMEWAVVEHLNRSPLFLQLYSMLNIVSPLFSLAMPIFILAFPFVLLRLKGIPITFEQYVETLKDIAKSHFIGRALNMQSFSFETVVYFLFTAGIYFLQTYQNAMSCIRFYNTMKRMNENLCYLREYLAYSVKSMDAFVKLNNTIPYYADFCQDVHSHKLVLQEIGEKIGPITGFCCYDWNKWASFGKMLETYYLIYASMDYEESLRYSVGFEGYMDILSGVSRNYLKGSLGKCGFSETGLEIDISGDEEDDDATTETRKDTVFVNQRYPAHIDGIKNTCCLDKNILITGVNASGKTTMLKTAAINVIVSQQFGFGFYESANVVPYKHVHSYINIPDTSGRDSLFQAESRRCKEILDKIRDTKDERHFCIFDELYSGTNPKEAAKSAYSLLRYLSKIEGVRFMLTTHYVSVCKRFDKDSLSANPTDKESTGKDSLKANPTDKESTGKDSLSANPTDKESITKESAGKESLTPTDKESLTPTDKESAEGFPTDKEPDTPDSNVTNYHMEATVDDSGTFHYTYRFKPGISILEGGLEILKTMDYPEEILAEIRNTQSM